MVENLKILILEDDQNDADLLLRELKKSGLIYTSGIVQTRKAFESALESFKPDIILADYSLPSLDGVTAFNIKQNTSPDIPFIIVSGVIGEENAVELIRNGVTDYVLKDKLFVLIPKINRALKEAEEKKEKRIADEELVFQNEEKEIRAAELIIANKELKKANERFELIGKATNDGLWDWNLETGLLWGNRVHQKLYGLSLADPVPNYEEWKHRIHPEDRERTVKALEETMASERNICITEYRLNTENIGWVNIYDRTLIERNKEGKPVRLIGSMMDITERKKAERAIKESEEKYRTLVEQASDAIFITDTAGRFIIVNASACKLSQYSEKELLKKTIYDLAVTEDLQKNPFHFDELKQGKTVINERVINRNNGILLNVEVTSKLLSDGRLLVFVRDISERKKTETAIRESEEKFRTLVQQAADGIFIVDQEGNYLEANESAAMLTGYSIDELKKMNASELIPTEELKKNPLKLEVIKKRGPVFIERVIRRKDKTLINVEVSAKLMDNGKVIVILRDITERKKTEKEILRVIDRYDMIAKATSDTIWDWDIINDKILYNEGIINMFGYEKTKIEDIADWWKNKIHPDDLQIVLEAVAAAFKKQSYNLQLEYRFRCADGSFKYIYDRVFVIYDEHKKPCRMIGAMQDVNKLKENEISLKELNKNLQKQAKELSIANEELKQFAIKRKKYIKAIEEQNKKLQDIAWTQSHIVRAPLSRMMGIVSIIRDLKIITSTEHEEWIKNFEDSANELDNIIHDIVNKIETKDIKLDEF